MISYKLFIFLTCIFNFSFCESEISKIFFETFTLDKRFNVTGFDEIYPNIIHNLVKWEQYSKMLNFTQNCQLVNNLTNSFTKNIINVKNVIGINSMNDYIYGRFLQSPCAKIPIKRKSLKFSVTEVWLYGFLTVTIINGFALLGIIFMPLVKTKFYSSIMTFMVSLAVGSLAGTAILILIPDAMRISEMAEHGGFNKNDYKWKATVVFAGLYFFFMTERLFKTIIYKNKVHTKNHEDLMQIENHSSLNNPTARFDGGTVVNIDTNNSEGKDIKHVIKQIEPVAWMIVFGDAIHNFVDGLSMGAAFSYDVMTGISVSLAIMCEELPHELGDFAVLISSGMTFKEAMFWNTMSALTCYLGFIIGVIVGEVTSASVWIFSIAGGMFLYISLVDMMNDIISTLDDMQCTKTKKITTFILQNLGLWTGYSIILIVALFGDQIQFRG